MNSETKIKFCPYCQEKTEHYPNKQNVLECGSCESTSDTETDYASDYDSDSDYDFIVSEHSI